MEVKNSKKILVVDDDVDMLLMLTILLRDAGYDVEGTLNGTETLERTNRFRPDLIIMDIFLTGINGRDVCKTLKSSDSTKRIPVILISSNPYPEAIGEYGAEDFIEKPFQISYMLSRVKQMMSNPVMEFKNEMNKKQNE